MPHPTFREQAERCRRLAGDSTDPVLRDRLLELAAEYAARADAQKSDPGAGAAGCPLGKSAALNRHGQPTVLDRDRMLKRILPARHLY